jgi:hypothetical protein
MPVLSLKITLKITLNIDLNSRGLLKPQIVLY